MTLKPGKPYIIFCFFCFNIYFFYSIDSGLLIFRNKSNSAEKHPQLIDSKHLKRNVECPVLRINWFL